ncbi:MAG: hypothetical protein IIT50_07620, partial [Bacteroidales bacterium]|nr:hypothetical protein [Bacteroidales bacterium]
MSIFTKIGEKYREWKQHPVGKVLLNKYFVVGFIFLVWICFFDTNNVGQMIRARVTLRRQQRQIEFTGAAAGREKQPGKGEKPDGQVLFHCRCLGKGMVYIRGSIPLLEGVL